MYGARVEIAYPNSSPLLPPIYVPADCGSSGWSGIVVVFPSLFGLVKPTRCTFDTSLRTNAPGLIQGQVAVVDNVLSPGAWVNPSGANGAPVRFNFDNAEVTNEVAGCATVWDGFLGGSNRLSPDRITSGTTVAAQSKPIRICRSTSFSFRATYGPFIGGRRRALLSADGFGEEADATAGAALAPLEAGNGRELQQTDFVCGAYVVSGGWRLAAGPLSPPLCFEHTGMQQGSIPCPPAARPLLCSSRIIAHPA